MTRIDIVVPYEQKDEAYALGAKWDPKDKTWYTDSANSSKFSKWILPPPVINLIDNTLPGEDLTFGGNNLYIDLIPENCWFTNVRSSVSAEYWNVLRKVVYKRAAYRCEICQKKGTLEAHERWDYNYTTRTQTLKRLICLCSNCHLSTHFGYAGVVGKTSLATEHLKRVNQWSDRAVQEHIAESFKVWRERSRISWTLDISILNNAGIKTKTPSPLRRSLISKIEIKKIHL